MHRACPDDANVSNAEHRSAFCGDESSHQLMITMRIPLLGHATRLRPLMSFAMCSESCFYKFLVLRTSFPTTCSVPFRE